MRRGVAETIGTVLCDLAISNDRPLMEVAKESIAWLNGRSLLGCPKPHLPPLLLTPFAGRRRSPPRDDPPIGAAQPLTYARRQF